MNYRKNDRWRSYRFYRALQRLKSPMRFICEIFGAPAIFEFFNTIDARRTFGTTAISAKFLPEAESCAVSLRRVRAPFDLALAVVVGLDPIFQFGKEASALPPVSRARLFAGIAAALVAGPRLYENPVDAMILSLNRRGN